MASAEDLPLDPTAFRPMETTADRELSLGYELSPITKKITLDKSRIYQGWPAVRNRHTDYAAAQATGLREPNINGGQAAECLGELFIKFFGTGFLGGSLAISFIGFVEIDDVLTARGVVTGKFVEDGRVRILLDVWAENQRGEKVIVGKASGFAP